MPEPKSTANVGFVNRSDRRLFAESNSSEGLLAKVLRPAKVKGASKQKVAYGEKPQPFDFKAASELVLVNIHHARCIRTKRNCTVGLGHKKPKTAKILDKLCNGSWQTVLNKLCEDYWNLANAYLEVVRDGTAPNAPITGLHHLPAKDVRIVVEDRYQNHHYLASSGEEAAGDVRLARYGDLLDLETPERLRRIQSLGFSLTVDNQEPGDDRRVSEIIPFQQESSLSRWYGIPDWIPATPQIELEQCNLQHNFDFYLNRGVPEFILFILGHLLTPKEFKELQKQLQANTGLGNSRKSIVLNIQGSEALKVQLEKLALEGKSDGSQFEAMSNVNAQAIVAAHGVPPLLAGILIPGKLGSSNEFPNALMSFQSTIIDQAQQDFTQTLNNTLGDTKTNGGLRLGPGAFDFKKVTESIDLGQADTIGRMRQTVPEAKAEGRDLSAGVKKAIEGWAKSDPEFGNVLAKLYEGAIKKARGRKKSSKTPAPQAG